MIGVLVTQAPEIGLALKAENILSAGKGVMITYIGISLGDFIAGFMAQMFKSRKSGVNLSAYHPVVFLLIPYAEGITETEFYWLAFMGIGVGYWATFITIAAEQFGTNIRATVTTTAPNFVRGSLIPSTILYGVFVHWFGIVAAALIMIVLLTGIAIFALSRLEESFDKDLDYLEE